MEFYLVFWGILHILQDPLPETLDVWPATTAPLVQLQDKAHHLPWPLYYGLLSAAFSQTTSSTGAKFGLLLMHLNLAQVDKRNAALLYFSQ